MLAADGAGTTPAEFQISAVSLADALSEFGAQSGMQLVYAPELARGLKSRALTGRFTIDAALKQLLAGTDLTWSYVNGNTVVLKRAEVKEISSTTSANPGPGTAEVKESVVEEIIVTATKRAENVQDVPISVAVVTADDIDRRGLVNSEDYLRGIPGVNQVDSGGTGGQAIVIRGLETSPEYQNFFSGATVATYFGETPTTSSAGLVGGSNVNIKLVDIERIEVLRGPQGTAFGSSAMGGVVRTIPVAPKLDRFEGKVSAGYSVTSGTGGDNYNVQAVGNIPLIHDKLAIRVAAYQYEDSGFYRNRAGSDAAFQAAVVNRYGAQAFATDKEEVGSYYALGGRIAALYQASDDLKFTLSYLTQKNQTDGSPVQTLSGPYEQAVLGVAPEHVLRGQSGGLSDWDLDIFNAMMEYDLDWADLLATYSYLKGGFVRTYSLTKVNIPLPVSSGQPDDSHHGNVGEVRLATKLDGAWNFLAGLYAEKHDQLYPFDLYWTGDPATNPFARGQRFVGDSREQRDLQQKAAFGEASWELLPNVTLTGGVRYFEYDRTSQLDTSGSLLRAQSRRVASEESGTTFRANLSYKPVDNALVYAGWSQGFRLGKPQVLQLGLCDPDSDGIVNGTNTTTTSAQQVESDTVDSYELGGKLAALGNRLRIDASLFLMEWSDIPVTVRPIPLCLYNINAGAARTEGVEIQANFQATDALRVDFGGSWIHAQLTKDVPGQGFSDGDRLPGSPKLNANLGVQYAFDIVGHAAFVRADSIYVGPFYGDVLQTPSLEAGGYVKLDASARVEIGNLKVDLFVRNLTNEDTFTWRGGDPRGAFFGYRMRPRTIGVQLGYDF